MQRAAALAGFAHIFPPDKYPFPDEAEHLRWMEIFQSPNVVILVAEREGQPGGGAVIGREELAISSSCLNCGGAESPMYCMTRFSRLSGNEETR
jgi:hypothetical protein